MQNLSVVSPSPLDSLGSVKRFVYAALLLCTSDNYWHQLRQRLPTSSPKKPRKVDHCYYFSSFRLYRQVLLLVLVLGDDNDCVFFGSIFLWMAVLRLSLPLACARPPSWILMLISFKKNVFPVIFSYRVSCQIWISLKEWRFTSWLFYHITSWVLCACSVSVVDPGHLTLPTRELLPAYCYLTASYYNIGCAETLVIRLFGWVP